MCRAAARAITVVVLVLTTGCSGMATDTLEFGSNLAREPTTTDELGGIGGATYLPMSLDEIARASAIGLEATVVDVKKSRLNTSDGNFPSVDQMKESGLSDLVVITDVILRVNSVIKDEAASPLAVGEEVGITVGGGRVDTMLSEDLADYLGIFEDTAEFTEEGIDPEPALPRGAVKFSYGTAPSESLTEGDRVVIFLTRVDISGYGGSVRENVLGPTHPYGLLYADEDGEWRSKDPNSESFTLSALATLSND